MAYNDNIIKALRESFKKDESDRFTNCALVFAYNGTGKTRLSYDFARYGRKENAPQHTLCYNAYTEDIFTWNNDPENSLHYLKIDTGSEFIKGLRGYNITESLHKYLSVFTDIDFNFHYDENNEDIPDYVWFVKHNWHIEKNDDGKDRLKDKPDEYIKISRGEERLFVWCFFRCIMDQVVGGNPEYKNIKYIYIDDPISSLDDNNVIAFAAQLYNVIRDSAKSERSMKNNGQENFRRINFIVSTHHALFFHVMYHGLNNDKKLGCFYLNRDKQTKEIGLKDMSGGIPFYYNVAIMSEVERAIKDDKLYTYHFTIMRSVMEKIAEFFGHFDYRYILDGITYKGNLFEESVFSKGELADLYSRIVNVFSHQGSFFAPSQMNEDNKDSLKTIFYHIKRKYHFLLPDLNDERSEKEIHSPQNKK